MKRPQIVYKTQNKVNAKTFTSLHPVVAEILLSRGFNTEEEMVGFIEKNDSQEYGEMKGMRKAVGIITDSINKNEMIIIYSDSDTDGCMSAAVGMILLRKLGARVDYYTNNRFVDGYGLCKNGIDTILKKHPDTKLIITADNGVAATDIAYAKELGLKVVVTDHHEAPTVLPPADAIVDPKQKGCNYRFKELCGAAVLYKVLRKVYKKLGEDESLADIVLELVAVATVGDVVPIIKENRMLASVGIKMINEKPSFPFMVIKELLELKEVTSHNTIAFLLTPMVNALSRIGGDVNPAVEVFISEDGEFIKKTVLKMKEINQERKRLTEEQYAIAISLIKFPIKSKSLVVFDPDFSEGIVGIMAGRIKEQYCRPAFVLTRAEEPGMLKGSARSINGFHLKEVLDEIKQEFGIIEKHGGHAKAAGLTLAEKDLELFRKVLEEKACAQLTDEDLRETVHLDVTMDSKELSIELVEEIYKLGPFGEGFPEPVIGLNYNVTQIYYMGTDKQHVKCYDRNTDISVICWNGTDLYRQLKDPAGKAVGRLSINEFRDKKSVQLVVKDRMIY